MKLHESVEAIHFLFTAVCLNWLWFFYVVMSYAKFNLLSQSKQQFEFDLLQVNKVNEIFIGNFISNLSQSFFTTRPRTTNQATNQNSDMLRNRGGRMLNGITLGEPNLLAL